jgi:DNA polymerase-3 subunit alpha
VTRHPLANHADVLFRFSTADCAELAEIGDTTEVVIGGMISRIRNVVTKNGRNAGSKMAVLTFEDLSGSTEAVVFSEDLDKHRDLIGPDKLVFLRGRVDRRRESPSLRVSDVIAFDEGSARLAEAVIVSVNTIGLDHATLARLRDVARAHPGDRPLFVRVNTPDGIATLIRSSEALNVRPDARFREDAERLLGAGAVEIVGMRRRPRRPAPAFDPEPAPDETASDSAELAELALH